MSFDPVAALFDEVLDVQANAQMRHKRAPEIAIDYTLCGGVHTFAVRVDGESAVATHAASIERAARLCREAFEAWQADSPDGLANALEVSIQEARR